MTAKRNYTPLDSDELVDPQYLGTGTPDGTKFLRDDQTYAVPSGSGAPSNADYLVGTAQGGLSAEIVVGTTPGGELGNTWASPTVDTTHSGSSHAGAASAAVSTHEGLSDPHTGYRLESAAILPADLDVTADNTTADATTGHHGLLPKLGGGSSNYLRADGTWAAPSGSGAPASVDYLVGTADGGLSAEIVVGTTPGGELGGTWASPTVDATHSGSTHAQKYSEATSFPGSPSTNDKCYRTDLNMLFYYDGTRWLSAEIFRIDYVIATAISATTGFIAFPAPPLMGGSDIWLLTWRDEVFITGGTALSASHKWVGTLSNRTAANGNAVIVTDTVDSGTLSNWLEYSTAINALQDNGSAKKAWVMTWTKTGTPGTLQAVATLTYRVVAT